MKSCFERLLRNDSHQQSYERRSLAGRRLELIRTRFSFLEESHEYKLESRSRQNKQPSKPGMPSQDLMSYWGTSRSAMLHHLPGGQSRRAHTAAIGYKFETLSLLPAPWDSVSRDHIENRKHEETSNFEQYCSIVQTGIGDIKMVLGGEVDAGMLL